jgi:hypothetical protein
MNVGIGKAVQFPEKEYQYINGIFVAVQPLRILSFLYMIKGLCHGSWVFADGENLSLCMVRRM